MAGHSKWSNIKHRKGRQDAKKGKVFTKISKEIFAAVRSGGDDPDTNTKLRMALNKAKSANMPNENIDRTIKKANGNIEGVSYEEITYEGYAPHGIAVYVEALTDNKNRTAAEVRLAFNKNNGNLGETGCVSFMFDRKGLLIIEVDENFDEEATLLKAIEAGAEDVSVSNERAEIYTSPEDFEEVKQQLESDGYNFIFSEVTMIPTTKTELDEQTADEVFELIDALEDNDDVQNVYHNLDIES
ncbi:YebC/PmpR family DNA-binding transcriptional regulator [Bacillus shivajii]|uniref:YebC/PmpR family DNA-binding transcriptional regulator n=1 Tax=Bacillus shivajii TaxID=1983719 RepID=UPI001CF9DFFE|nr:YebC/PmpR family DNA-binding transcriptional regulator [Bacillus shivajii]UCZ54345.1 YebC/PmpR family DNA-binding transcriptional regulator [Bacillus shivajii]